MNRAATIVVTAVLWASAQAQPVPLDPQLLDRQRAFLEVFARTRICMRDAVRSIVRAGVTDRAQVREFILAVCSSGMNARLHADGVSAEDARGLLGDMADRAINQDAPDPHQPPVINRKHT